MKKIPTIGIIGMGGFAQTHHQMADELEAQSLCRVCCSADPRMEDFAEFARTHRWEERGIRQYTDYRDMLRVHGAELDVVMVPTPIHLHAEMHRACVEAGVACYLEKPPTLDPDEFDAMMQVESRARTLTGIGFHKLADPFREDMKRRILSGEFGPLQRVSFFGLAPRGSDYYGRNNWAGRLLRKDRLLLDSCFGNADSHFLHTLLYGCGVSGLGDWAELKEVEAELYRIHPIQGTDTVFARGLCSKGIEWRLAVTHACPQDSWTEREILECENAKLTLWNQKEWRIEWTDGREEIGTWTRDDFHRISFADYLAYGRGERDRPRVRLIDTRSFVQLNALLYVAAGRITDVGPEHAAPVASPVDAKNIFRPLTGVREASETLLATGRLPSEQGLPWAMPGGRALATDASRLGSCIAAMAESSPFR